MANEIIDLNDYNIETGLISIDEADLEKRGYRKLSKDAYSKIDFLAQYVPGNVAQKVLGIAADKAVSEAAENAFKVVLKDGMHLGKSSTMKGAFKGMAFLNEGNTLKSMPDLIPLDTSMKVASMAPQLALGVFNAMSIATGQYFMSEINSKLKTIDTGINDIKSFLEVDKQSEILSDRLTLEQLQRDIFFIIDNETQVHATSVELKRIKSRSLSNCNFYKTQIERVRSNLKNYSKFDTYKWVIWELEKRYPQYLLSVHNYIMATFLDAYVTGMDDPDYLTYQYIDSQNLIVNYCKSFEDSDKKAKAYIKHNSELNKRDGRAKNAGAVADMIPPINTWFAAIHAVAAGVEIYESKEVKKSESKKRDAWKREQKLLEACSNVTPLNLTVEMIKRYNETRNSPVEMVFVNDSAYVKIKDVIIENDN